MTSGRMTTTPERSALMKRVRQRDTPGELAVRRALWKRGVGFRVQASELPGTPDLVNRARRWAIFVHGCFWHGHENCSKARVPRRNHEAWETKLAANRARDRAKVAALEQLGFTVWTIWECEALAPATLEGRLDRMSDRLLERELR